MPGLVNAHVHGHGTLAKGLVGDRWPLELFLNAMPGMAGNRTIEDKYLNGLVAAVEMIRKGCTACYDLFFEFPIPSLEGVGALGRAYRDAGLRAVIAPMLADKTLYQAYPGLIDAHAGGAARRRARLQACAVRSHGRCGRKDLRRLAVRSRLDPAGHRADHSASLQRRVPHPLPRSCPRLRSAAADASRRDQGAGGARHCGNTARR